MRPAATASAAAASLLAAGPALAASGGDGGLPWPGVALAVVLAGAALAYGLAHVRKRETRTRAILAAAFAHTAGAAMITDGEGHPIEVTADWRETVGGDSGAPLAGLAHGFFTDADGGSEIARLHDAATRGQTAETTLGIAGPGRARRRLVAAPLGEPDGYVLWRLSDPDGVPETAPTGDADALDRLSRLVGQAGAAVCALDPSGRLTYADARLAAWLGLGEDALAEGVPLADYLASPAAPEIPAGLGAAGTLVLRGRDGRSIVAEYVRTALARSGTIETTLVLADRSREDAAPARRSALDGFRALFDPLPVGMALLDDKGTVIAGNGAFAKIAGTEPRELAGTAFAAAVLEDDRARLERWIATSAGGRQPLVPLEVRLAGRDGALCLFAGRLPGDGSAGAPRLVVYAEQRGGERHVDQQLFQSQKLELIGQLAGGIAHDFNNLLQAMIGFCDLLLQRHSPKDHAFADIMQIKQNANRAANLVRQLLAFSRQQTLQPRMLNLTDVLAELSNLLRRLIGASIELKMVHGRDIGLIKADQSQFEQVVINLAVNARDAMAEGGTLTITTGDVRSGDPRIADFHDLPDRDYVMLAITDTGCGIPKDVIDKIYEPFFTTKGVGAGTGLGLATVYGIIQQTGGHIFVDSTPGKGTTFTIFLPRYEAEAVEAAEDGGEAEAEAPRDLTGAGTVLLVEDEDAVRLFGARALRNKGYKVLEARDGENALDVLTGADEPIDLLISDVVMPGIDGPSLIRRVRESHPDLKVIFISGYTEDSFRERLDEGEEVHFLAKPFSLQDLAGKVKEVIRAP